MSNGNGLKAALQASGLTQREIARELGVTTGMVSQWVNGLSKIPKTRLAQITGLIGWVPEYGDGSEYVEEALDNLEGFLHEQGTPLAYLMLQGLPEALKPKAMPYERELVLRATVDRWATHLGMSTSDFVDAIGKRQALTKRQVEKMCSLAGWSFYHLATHVAVEAGPEVERAAVFQFLMEASTECNTFAEVRLALDTHQMPKQWVSITEAHKEYVMPKAGYDVDANYEMYLEMQAEYKRVLREQEQEDA